MQSIRDFLAELRRRKVVRAALAYIAVGWILIEAADVLLGNFGAPAWVFRAFAVLVLLGLPLAIVLAWAFELTPQGVRRDPGPAAAEPPSQHGRRLDFVIIASLAAALGYFIWNHDWRPEPAPTESAYPASIAVLPFVNMSGEPENEYFSDGLAEELISLLTRESQLRVVGRSSSFAFKGRTEDLRTIGEILGVDSVLGGSVRRDAERVRISARLSSTADGYQIWADTYDRTLGDIFAVQEDIARSIVAALGGETSRSENIAKQVYAARTQDPEAHRLYLEARYHFHRRGEQDLRRSIALYERAIARDPDYAAAYAGLSAAVFVLPGYSLDTYGELANVARRHAERALELDGALTEAEVVLGALDRGRLDWVSGRQRLERAVAQAPGSPLAHHWYAIHLLAAGQLEEGLAEVQEAHRLDPLSAVVTAWVGNAYATMGDMVAAERHMRIAVGAGRRLARFYMFRSAATRGDFAEAERWLLGYTEGLGVEDSFAPAIVAAMADPTRLDVARLEMEAARSRLTIPWHTVQLLVLLGDTDEAMEVAFAALGSGDVVASLCVWLADMAPLRRHPRFPDLIESMALPAYWDAYGWPPYCEPTADGPRCR